jgi:glutamate-1-semialdehyde 2,1-aminomutase
MAVTAVDFETTFRQRTPRSAELNERAKGLLPLGVSGNAKYYDPYPFYIREARGGRIVDIDDNEYLDFLIGAGANILGHLPEAVVSAVIDQLGRAALTYGPTPKEVDLAERITQHMPWIERVRFSASGTEATQMALRAARAFSGRPRIAKFEGHWHGQHDAVLFSSLRVAGEDDNPTPIPDSAGLMPGVEDGIVILPFNDLEQTERLIETHKDELAAVIMEAVGGFMTGLVPGTTDFIQGVREITRKAGVLLLLDEVITGFRLGLDGAAGHYGIEPDLVTLGKIIGGGLPIGAYCGRAEILDSVLSPSRSDPKRIFQSGTFSGNPLSATAGVAVIDELARVNPYERLAAGGDRVRAGLAQAAADAGLDVQITGIASMFHTVFTAEAIKNKRSVARADAELLDAFGMGLLANGVFITPGHPAFLSAAHSDEDIDQLLEVARDVMTVLARRA